MKAIIYTSHTGHTQQYAQLLSEALKIPSYTLKEASKNLTKDDEVIYMGWLMGGLVSGLIKAQKKFKVTAVCGVGMSDDDSQISNIRKINNLSEDIKVFYLEGGFEFEKVHGFPKLMISMLRNAIYKKVESGQECTETDKQMYRLFKENKCQVSKDKIKTVVKALK